MQYRELFMDVTQFSKKLFFKKVCVNERTLKIPNSK